MSKIKWTWFPKNGSTTSQAHFPHGTTFKNLPWELLQKGDPNWWRKRKWIVTYLDHSTCNLQLPIQILSSLCIFKTWILPRNQCQICIYNPKVTKILEKLFLQPNLFILQHTQIYLYKSKTFAISSPRVNGHLHQLNSAKRFKYLDKDVECSLSDYKTGFKRSKP